MEAENYYSGYLFFNTGDKIVVLKKENDRFCDERQKHYDIDDNGIAHRKDKKMFPLGKEEMKRIKRLITNPRDNVTFPPRSDEGYALYKDTNNKFFYVDVKRSKLGIKMEHKDIVRVSQVGIEELRFSTLEKNSAF